MPAHLELGVDSEMKALIPDGVSAVLDHARLELVAGGRGQPQSHVAVRGGHCGKEEGAPGAGQEPFPAQLPRAHVLPSQAAPGDLETQGMGLGREAGGAGLTSTFHPLPPLSTLSGTRRTPSPTCISSHCPAPL